MLVYRASGALLAPLHLGQVNQSSSDCGAARGGRSVLLLRCRGSAGSACVSISLMRGAHAVRAPARSASSVMLARRGPCMSCGDAERRAAGVLEWTTPRLRTGAMNLSGRTPTHTRCWVCGGVPLQVRSAASCLAPPGVWLCSELFLWVRPPATRRFDALFLVRFRPHRSSASQRVPAADAKKSRRQKKRTPHISKVTKVAHRWWFTR